MAAAAAASTTPDRYKGRLANFVFAIITLFLGILGQLITRFLKKSWKTMWWAYIPIFWPPVILSWPVSIGILMGKMD